MNNTKADFRIGTLATIMGLAAMMSTSTQAQLLDHLVLTPMQVSGPDGKSGSPRAHVGEPVNVLIQVVNLDECLDTITVQHIFVTIHHGSGDVLVPDLASNGLVRLSYGKVAGFSTGFVVETNDADFLSVEYEVYFTDNWDGLCGFGPPLTFYRFFGDHLQVLKPVADLVQQSDVSAAYPTVSFSGIVTNTGNTPLYDVAVVSDGATPGNSLDDIVIRIGTVNPGSVAPYAGSYRATSPSSRNTVTVQGFDPLGLLVNRSSTRGFLVGLRITRHAPDAVRISWPDWGLGLRLESCGDVDESWASVTNPPTSGEREFQVIVGMSTNQFYRLVKP